ncbi:hypothetical protein [Tropicimonas sp. S265A]|uniref:hypothetical protein n=1 Tax=Tropicimonas sp. S265A TaxID=3415134 RepID=UPI003C7ABF17
MSEDVKTSHLPDLPFYVTPMGETDTLMIFMIVFVLVLLVLGGVFYLHLHSVPDRMAHKANSTQLQLIGILTLIALLTHNNIFWIAAIILAALNPPDLMTPIQSIARSLQRMSGTAPQDVPTLAETAAEEPDPAPRKASDHA